MDALPAPWIVNAVPEEAQLGTCHALLMAVRDLKHDASRQVLRLTAQRGSNKGAAHVGVLKLARDSKAATIRRKAVNENMHAVPMGSRFHCANP